jgi:hypothetical protein
MDRIGSVIPDLIASPWYFGLINQGLSIEKCNEFHHLQEDPGAQLWGAAGDLIWNRTAAICITGSF